MIRKTVKYVDYDDNEREESFYFNLSKAELLELEADTPGGLIKFFEKMIAEKDSGKMVFFFKKLLLMSYGEKTPDGRRFVKSKELTEAFSQTEAYSDLFMELANNSDSAIEFVKGIIPQSAAKDATGLALAYTT